MDFSSLRQAGLRHLERMIGDRWSDFNPHDPGITILEQLCYALTDLGYRISHGLPDLLAEAGADPYESLYSAAQILTTQPVTVRDLRTLLVDVEGVRNAWVEPLWHDPVEEQEIALHYVPRRDEIRHGEAPAGSESLRLKGLYRVLIENADPARLSAATLRSRVASRLHANRGLCEDFAEIRVLEPQWVRVQARVEIAPVDDVERVLAALLEGLARHISPPLTFGGEEQLAAARRVTAERPDAAERQDAAEGSQKSTAAAKTVDELFDGPLLNHGFLAPEALSQAQRRTVLKTSDLIQIMMDVPGVRAVRTLSLSAEGEAQAWSLRLDPTRAPALDLAGSQIQLECQRIKAGGVDLGRGGAAQNHRPASSSPKPRPEAKASRAASRPLDLTPPAGRDRRVGHYDSIQRQFPAVYGIGELGLPTSAPAKRKAQARQLEAYLMFFDQLLANTFAQLAHVGDLFSFHDEPLETAFSASLEDPALGLDALFVEPPAVRAEHLRRITRGPQGSSLEHKNRLLSHLLARFSEPFADYALVLFESMIGDADSPELGGVERVAEKLARDKQAFLRRYPRVSGARGTAHNGLQPSAALHRGWPAQPRVAEVSGLEERVRLKLGFISEVGEDLVLVEHILLRPGPHDQIQEVPLLAAPVGKDPYSLQLSFALPESPERFRNLHFRRFIEQTLRDETPVHLVPYVHWLSPSAWGELCCVHREWLRRRSEVLHADYGGSESVATGPNADSLRETIHLRAIRDRLLDLLGIGETFPLQDAVVREVPATAECDGPQIDRGRQTDRILVWPGPADVRYELCNPVGIRTLAASRNLPGHTAGLPPSPLPERGREVGREHERPGPALGRIRAIKLDTGREAYLHQGVDLDLVPAASASTRGGIGERQLGVSLAVGTSLETPVTHSRQRTELVVATDPLGLSHSPGLERLRLGVDFVIGADPFDPRRRPGVGQMRVEVDWVISGGTWDGGLGHAWLEVDLTVAG